MNKAININATIVLHAQLQCGGAPKAGRAAGDKGDLPGEFGNHKSARKGDGRDVVIRLRSKRGKLVLDTSIRSP